MDAYTIKQGNENELDLIRSLFPTKYSWSPEFQLINPKEILRTGR